MHINDLTDDCFRFVFDHFSLQQLIQLRSVCGRWRDLIETIFAHKSSLKLFESFNVIFNYCNCLVQYNLQHNEEFVLKSVGYGDDDLLVEGSHSQEDNNNTVGELLVKLFPSLNKLVFYYYNWPTQMDLPFFLNRWQHLTSLALLGMPHLPNIQQRIWSSINSLDHLTHLHLFEMSPIPEDMSVLSQLTHFSLVIYDGDIVPVLMKLGPAIRNLVLDGITCSFEALDNVLKSNEHLAQNVTHLTIGNLFTMSESKYKSRGIHKNILSLICSKFSALKYFHPMFVYELPLSDQISELVKLKSLPEIRLRIDSFQMNLNANQAEKLAQLRTISILNLDYILMDNNIQLNNLIPAKFYNVHTINIMIQCVDEDLAENVKQYFMKLRDAQKEYSMNITDNRLSHYIGRHKRRYLQTYEND